MYSAVYQCEFSGENRIDFPQRNYWKGFFMLLLCVCHKESENCTGSCEIWACSCAWYHSSFSFGWDITLALINAVKVLPGHLAISDIKLMTLSIIVIIESWHFFVICWCLKSSIRNSCSQSYAMSTQEDILEETELRSVRPQLQVKEQNLVG